MTTLTRVILTMMMAAPVFAAGQAPVGRFRISKAPAVMPGQTKDATTVLAGVQKAIGGADKVAAVKTLTATGTSTRVTANGAVEGPVEVAIEFPDKYMIRTVIGGQAAMAIYRNIGFNGTEPINITDAPPNLNEAMRARLNSDRATIAAGREQTAEDKAALAMRQVIAQKKEFARLTFGLFGASYAAFPLEFSYAGQADAADGQADVVEAKGADGFDVRLFVDTTTHLPLMLTWSDPGAGANAGKMIERRMYFSDFKKTDGLNLPYTLKRSVDGKPTEETVYAEIKVNPKIDARKFAVAK